MAGGSADASGAAEKRVMYQQLSKGGTNAALTRHINFVAPAGEVSGPESASTMWQVGDEQLTML